MRRIGIFTIVGDANYGNKLQNYAVERILSKYGFFVETIRNENKNGIIKKMGRIVKKNINLITNRNYGRLKEERIKNFNIFNKENIKYRMIDMKSKENREKIDKEYEYFFSGSDQVWNPTFGRMTDIDFLTFTKKEKRNTISASFGISEIPENMKEYYKERINELNNISVREERGKEIIEELTGRKDVTVLLDPTMMLTSKEWTNISKVPKRLNGERYILNYFLGELNIERKKEIERIAKENKCIVINILDQKNLFYGSGPSEFLYLEKNAFLICTDSFHSCVFAILFNRPFIIFEREDHNHKMNSRLETLINKFKLENRYYDTRITKENLEIDYSNINKILTEERKKGKKYIEKVLQVGKE